MAKMPAWMPSAMLLMAFGGSQPVLANSFKMDFVRTIHSMPADAKVASGKQPQPFDKNEKISVVLGKSRFLVKGQDSSTLYDIASRRILTIKTEDKTYSEASLFAMVAFRHFEIQNRKMLIGILDKALAAKNQHFMDPVFCEAELSMRMPDSTTGTLVKFSQKGDTENFSYDSEVIATCTPSTTAIPADNITSFDQALLYNMQLHPVVREQIEKSGKVPQKLTSLNVGAAIVKTEWQLESCAPGDDNALKVPESYQREMQKDDPLNTIFNNFNQTKRLSSQAAVAQARAYQSAGDTFDAVLTILEANLTCNDDLTEGMEILKAAGKNDDLSKTLFANIESHSKAEAEQHCQKLEELAKKSKDKSYVVGILEAGEKANLGDAKSAKALYLTALHHNAHITGAYIDLGNLFMAGYDTVSAWTCFDLAKQICPTYKGLDQIYDLERTMEKDHPEYFQ